MATSIEHKAYANARLAKSSRNAIARLARWLSNINLPSAAYRALMTGRLFYKVEVYTRVAKEEALEFGGLQADIEKV